MADSGPLFCHACQHEWTRDRNGLECPECHSGAVEMVESGYNPREDSTNDDNNDEAPQRLAHLLHNHNHWNIEPPSSDNGDIEHVEWNTFPGLRFSRTSYRSSTPGMGPAGQRINDPFAPFFQSFSTIMEGTAGGQRQAAGSSRPTGTFRSPARSPGPGSMPPFPHTHDNWTPGPSSAPGTPLREGLPGQGFGGGRSTYTATTRVWPRDGNTIPQHARIENLQGLLGTLIQSINGLNQNGPNPQAHAAIPPLHLFAQLLNPAHAADGDVVYTEEALDRVITQFMEQAHGSTAPGPASAEAISRLPKKKADKNMMGSDGKAECSVCMDNVEIGDEVTVLPCSHWFHGECVGAWLKEHDTCPHCRQGIMPKEGGAQASAPRTPSQPPMNNSQSPPVTGSDGNRGLHFTWQQATQPPPQRAPEPQSRQHGYHNHHTHHRRRSSAREGRNGGEGSSGGGGGGGGSSSGSGGFGGWVRDRWRGNSDRS